MQGSEEENLEEIKEEYPDSWQLEVEKIKTKNLERMKSHYSKSWQAVFALTGEEINDKPINPSKLNDLQSKLVKTIVKIYTMESFIVYNLKRTSLEEDVSMLAYYGPYAALLSYIIGFSYRK